MFRKYVASDLRYAQIACKLTRWLLVIVDFLQRVDAVIVEQVQGVNVCYLQWTLQCISFVNFFLCDHYYYSLSNSDQ